MARGYFFTLDAFLAIGIILVGMLVIYSYNPFAPSPEQSYAYAHDTINLFTETALEDLNEPYIEWLINQGYVTNKKNTLMEQIGEFYFKAKLTGNTPINYTKQLQNMLEYLTDSLVEEDYGIGFYVNEEPVYIRGDYTSDALLLISSSTPAVGIYNTTTLWGPYQIEVRVWK